MHYVRFYVKDVASARTEAKVRATRAIFWTSVITGAIAFAGVAMALWNKPWIGLVTAGLAGASAAIAAWDHYLGHEPLWRQRSRLLTELQILQEEMEFRLGGREARNDIAASAHSRLAALLRQGFEDWDSMRQARPSSAIGRQSPPTV
jgi:hypothetical protein